MVRKLAFLKRTVASTVPVPLPYTVVDRMVTRTIARVTIRSFVVSEYSAASTNSAVVSHISRDSFADLDDNNAASIRHLHAAISAYAQHDLREPWRSAVPTNY